jgi:acetyl-CoA C-acetyltransferase
MNTSRTKAKLSGKYAIVGIGEAGLGRAEAGDTALTLQARAARDALRECALLPRDIDAVFAHWDEKAMAMLVAEYMGITANHVNTTLVGGQSSLTHIGQAIAAIEAGLCHTALITYGSTQRLDSSRKMAGQAVDPRSPVGQFVQPWGMPSPIGFYAMQAQLHQHRYGSGPRDLAEVAISARQWARLNPKIDPPKPLTYEDYLAAPMICEPLRKYDICRVQDGAGAVIVTSMERALDLPTPPVPVLGFAEVFRHHMAPLAPGNWLESGHIPRLTDDALGMAGRTRDDLDVVQIYDAFTIGVLSGLEELGFCAPGEAGCFIAGGRIAPGGDFPLNTSGGGLAFNHSGMFGMQLLIETVEQMRGTGGKRQVKGAKTSLMLAGGIVNSAHHVMVLGSHEG